MLDRQSMEAGILIPNFDRLTTAAIVMAVVLLFAVPFVLTLVTPFIGR